jgi:CubicO group peptidase (beta-lactamase class C family)
VRCKRQGKRSLAGLTGANTTEKLMSLRSSSAFSSVLRATSLVALLAAGACSSDDDTVVPDDSALDAAQRAELEGWIDDALVRYEVPGAAVAIVRGRDVIYEGGFGVRGLEDRTPVTADTRFMIGSVSKSVTSLMAATLVDEGKLSWDARVVDELPGFALSDPASTSALSVRNLFNHTHGVARNDTALMIEPLPPTEMIGSLRDLPIVAPPGETFIYHNQTYSTAGFLAVLADGARYDDESLRQGYARSMRQRVFEPLGMTRTTLDFDAALADPDHALPTAFSASDGSLAPVPPDRERFTLTTSPAGAIWSSVSDMAAYASTQLTGLAPDGTRIVSDERLSDLHEQAISYGEGEGYAMGWNTRDSYLGTRAVWHDGEMNGFTSEVLLLPELDVAVVVLTNRVAALAFYRAVQQFAVETALLREHAGDADLIAESDDLLSQVQALAASTYVPERDEVEAYLGDYDHGTSVAFGEQGFALTTELGTFPLVATGEPGQFASGGVISNFRFTAAFDREVSPPQLTVDMFFTEAPQPFVLERVGE